MIQWNSGIGAFPRHHAFSIKGLFHQYIVVESGIVPAAPVVLAGGGGRIELGRPTRVPRRSEDLRRELEKLFGLVQEAQPEQVEQQRAEIRERITKDKARVQRAVPVLDPPALAQFNLLIQRIEAIVDRKVEQVREQEEEDILFLL